jgi:hypothetical protein
MELPRIDRPQIVKHHNFQPFEPDDRAFAANVRNARKAS